MAVGFEFDASSLVQGLEQLANGLDPAAFTAMSKGADDLAADAKARAPRGETSLLSESVQPIRPTGSFRAGTLEAGAIAAAPYAIFVELGTEAHDIPVKHRKSLRWPVADGWAFAKVVEHPGTDPQPFMAPALEATADAITNELSRQVQRAITKAGF